MCSPKSVSVSFMAIFQSSDRPACRCQKSNRASPRQRSASPAMSAIFYSAMHLDRRLRPAEKTSWQIPNADRPETITPKNLLRTVGDNPATFRPAITCRRSRNWRLIGKPFPLPMSLVHWHCKWLRHSEQSAARACPGHILDLSQVRRVITMFQ